MPSSERRFLVAFALAVLLGGVLPLLAAATRFAALGEFELVEDDAAIVAQRLHGPLDLSELAYKFRMVRAREPRVLMLGSSQVLQFRMALFDRCASADCFYNGGGGMPTARAAFDLFAEATRGRRPPDVLLLAVDPWHVNPRYEENTHGPTPLRPTMPDKLRFALGITRKFAPRIVTDADLRDLVLGVTQPTTGVRGIRANLRSEGFRDDGSYSYGTVAVAEQRARTPVERSADVVDRIARDCCRFQRFDRADERALAELDELLALAARVGTKVVAFAVPLSDTAMDAVDADAAERASFDEFERSVARVFQGRGVPFVPLRRASQAGCPASEMVDGFHPGEVCAGRVLLAIAERPDAAATLRPYIDVGALRRRIDRSVSGLLLDAP